jgi:hypothetical protein
MLKRPICVKKACRYGVKYIGTSRLVEKQRTWGQEEGCTFLAVAAKITFLMIVTFLGGQYSDECSDSAITSTLYHLKHMGCLMYPQVGEATSSKMKHLTFRGNLPRDRLMFYGSNSPSYESPGMTRLRPGSAYFQISDTRS